MKHLLLRITAVVSLLLLAGCGAHKLSQAQDRFNAAARLEASAAELRNPSVDGSNALQNYRIALSLSEEALESYGSSLKQDKLYGTALVLKALCEWRIAALDADADAEKIKRVAAWANKKAAEEGITLGTRDRVLLAALPGFREQTLAGRETDPEKRSALYASALETLDLALSNTKPPSDHPVRIYIRLFQMRTVRAWRWADYATRPTEPSKRTQWLEKFKERYLKYRNALAPFLAADDALYAEVRKMDREIGVTSDPRK
jgi:hypothetical protein